MRLQLFIVFAALTGAAAKPLRNTADRKRKLLLISFDGFRWDYDQDVETPNMDQLGRDGVKAKYITPPMLTMTSPSHFTTITGTSDLLSSTLFYSYSTSYLLLFFRGRVLLSSLFIILYCPFKMST